jgi:hypothetical protein
LGIERRGNGNGRCLGKRMEKRDNRRFRKLIRR